MPDREYSYTVSVIAHFSADHEYLFSTINGAKRPQLALSWVDRILVGEPLLKGGRVESKRAGSSVLVPVRIYGGQALGLEAIPEPVVSAVPVAVPVVKMRAERVEGGLLVHFGKDFTDSRSAEGLWQYQRVFKAFEKKTCIKGASLEGCEQNKSKLHQLWPDEKFLQEFCPNTMGRTVALLVCLQDLAREELKRDALVLVAISGF